jgi:hypothetical protein
VQAEEREEIPELVNVEERVEKPNAKGKGAEMLDVKGKGIGGPDKKLEEVFPGKDKESGNAFCSADCQGSNKFLDAMARFQKKCEYFENEGQSEDLQKLHSLLLQHDGDLSHPAVRDIAESISELHVASLGEKRRQSSANFQSSKPRVTKASARKPYDRPQSSKRQLARPPNTRPREKAPVEEIYFGSIPPRKSQAPDEQTPKPWGQEPQVLKPQSANQYVPNPRGSMAQASKSKDPEPETVASSSGGDKPQTKREKMLEKRRKATLYHNIEIAARRRAEQGR